MPGTIQSLSSVSVFVYNRRQVHVSLYQKGLVLDQIILLWKETRRIQFDITGTEQHCPGTFNLMDTGRFFIYVLHITLDFHAMCLLVN